MVLHKVDFWGIGGERRLPRRMRWIALAIAVYAVIEWAQAYAPMYQWIQDLPIWLGHIFFGIMFSASVIGIIKLKSSS